MPTSVGYFFNFMYFLVIAMAPEKTVGPLTTLAFAGIELDTVLMEARLLQEKLDKCRDLLSTFLRRRKITLQEIQSLMGLLNFACTVIVPGRAFLRRLIDLTIGARKPQFLIRLSKDVKENLLVWQSFFSGFNGRSFFLADQWTNSNQLELYTDASGALGYGAVFGRHWCYGQWPHN